MTMLRQHGNLRHTLARGFLVAAEPSGELTTSREHDIIIADLDVDQPLFYENGLMIASPSVLRGAVSVKSSYTPTVLDDSLSVFTSSMRLPRDSQPQCAVALTSFFFNEDHVSAVQIQNACKKMAAVLRDVQPSSDVELMLVLMTGEIASVRWHAPMQEIKCTAHRCGTLVSAVWLAMLADYVRKGSQGLVFDLVSGLEFDMIPIVV